MPTVTRTTAEQIRQNLIALLQREKVTPAVLANAIGKHRSWMTRFLNRQRNELQLQDIDRIADFFQLVPFDLVKPSTGSFTDRRRIRERRTGMDRRINRAERDMLYATAELQRVSPPATGKGRHATAPVVDPIQRVIEQAARDINRLRAPMEDAGRQAPVARRATAPLRPRAGAAGGSTDPAGAPPVKPK